MLVNLSENMKHVIQRCVIDPVMGHTSALGWDNLLGSKKVGSTFDDATKDDIRQKFVGQGQSDFTKPYDDGTNKLTEDEKALLYAYSYLQMHFSSTFAVFNIYAKLSAFTFFVPVTPRVTKKLAFIDIGCGTFTAGLGFLEYCNEHFKTLDTTLELEYVGVDIAQSMLALAKKISTEYQSTTSGFTFKKIDYKIDYHDILKCKYDDDIEIVINCCYFFASSSLIVADFFAVIEQFIKTHSANRIYFLYQNPVYYGGNKYNIFLNSAKFYFDKYTSLNKSPFSFNDFFNCTKYNCLKRDFKHQLLIKP